MEGRDGLYDCLHVETWGVDRGGGRQEHAVASRHENGAEAVVIAFLVGESETTE